ncbi:hypothetical protein [Pseudonocardia sp. NPDC049154]|uniref:hypothetical protein n=1 Tax=Pseudonocardia sp. NPDC049154 TaxID=3155501 RepID=UPI0033D1C78D
MTVSAFDEEQAATTAKALPAAPSRDGAASSDVLTRRMQSRKSAALWVCKLLIGAMTLLFAFQPETVKTVFAGYYGPEIYTVEQQDDFVATIITVAERGWLRERLVGRRLQLDTVIYGRDLPGTEFFPPPTDKVAHMDVPTAACPGGRGGFLRLFFYGVDSSRFGAQNAREKEYALEGIYDVGTVRFRTGNKGPFCHIDLRLVQS